MLNKRVKGTFLKNEPMAKHTSYGIGGPAQAYITPSDQNDLKQILIFSKDLIPPPTSTLILVFEIISSMVFKLTVSPVKAPSKSTICK